MKKIKDGHDDKRMIFFRFLVTMFATVFDGANIRLVTKTVQNGVSSIVNAISGSIEKIMNIAKSAILSPV